MTRMTKVSAIAVTLFALVGAGAASAGLVFIGDDGVGDPYYPRMGNTGYEVEAYDVDLAFQSSGKIKARTTIQAVVDTNETGKELVQFDLDYRGPRVTKIVIDGVERPDFAREGQELIIPTAEPLADGEPFEVVVRYKGRPRQVSNPDGSKDGWTETGDGAVALGEPQQTPSWVPVNDHPTDKAAWTFRFTTPKELMAISNGTLVDSQVSGNKRTTEWEQQEPMASYLALAAIGKFRVDEGAVNGIPYVGAVDKKLGNAALESLHEKTEVAHDFLETVAGPYPFANTGGIADPSSLGFAMETQTRSYYPGSPNQQLVIHEVAHQWFGDSVSVDRWQEIWLNEGFATYMEWVYEEEQGGETVADRFVRIWNANGPNSAFWDPAPADPEGPENLFAGSVYDRGAMALEVLRLEIGDDDFFEVVQTWAQSNQYGNVSTEDLYALIGTVTGEDRPDLFDDWLYEDGRQACPASVTC